MSSDVHPLVTIAIPTYNRADGYLGQAIESALSQTYREVEVIVSDNCSMDNTEAVVAGFSSPHLRYFRHTENIGANNNFNFCLEQAKGDYFLLLHDDDVIDNDFVGVCMKAANYDTDFGIIRTGTRLIDSQGQVLEEIPNTVGGLSTEDFFLGWFARKTALYLCSTLFNTKGLREIGAFRSKHNLFQDVVAEVQLASTLGRVDVQDIKASFRKHATERTFTVKVNDWCEDSLLLLDLMCELVSENRALVRQEGMRFFCRRNYVLASKIKSLKERCITFLTVFRMFDYCYSPLAFLMWRNRHLRRLKRANRKVKKLLVSALQHATGG